MFLPIGFVDLPRSFLLALSDGDRPMAMDELLGGGVLVPGAASPLTAGSMVYPADV